MKIVVTGALGHIGSKLIRELPTHFPDCEVIMIDNLMTQRLPSLFNLPKTGRFRFVEADVTTTNLDSLLEGAHTVVHLAAITDAAGSFEKKALVESNNFNATKCVAEACLRSGSRLIALSSTSVYGTQEELISEDCPIEDLKPQSPYAETKLREEDLVRRMHRDSGLKAVLFRFGTIFGISPGMRFHTAVNKFCWQAVMGQPLTVWRTAYNQKRPYLDLHDAVNAICFMIRQDDRFDGQVYNVLTQNASVQQIADTIRAAVPELQISFVDSKIMNQLSYEVSCERFTSLGFTFTGDLRHGVDQTIDLLRHARSA